MQGHSNSATIMHPHQTGKLNLLASVVLLTLLILSCLSSPAIAKSTSLARSSLDVSTELRDLGFFPQLFGTGLAAYNSGDYQHALRIWRPMAEAGHALAEYNLGVAYARGLSVERNVVVASYWWQRAAMQGNRDASYNLGLIYARGDGDVGQDMALAAHWWQQAAIHGDAVAQYNLGMMYARGEGVPKNIETAKNWWQLSADQGFDSAIKMLDQIATNSR